MQSFVASTDHHTNTQLPVCMNTSTPIISIDEQGHENVHIIPLDDDDQSFHDISGPTNKIVINELD